jgi:RNA polymerase sigma-70 factor (family 1)
MNKLPTTENISPDEKTPEKSCVHLFFHTYNTYKTYLYQLSFSITKNKQVSEDISQEVFLNLWSHKEQLTTIKNLKAFIGTAARNLSIDYLRRQTLANHVIMEYISTQHNYLDLNEYFDRKETERLLQLAIQSLTPHRRAVFILGWMEGLTRDQISARLGITPNTVKSLMQKARHDIRIYFTHHTGLKKTILLRNLKHLWSKEKTAQVA